MDLNFVDPPIPADVQPYQPVITAKTASDEFDRFADWVETDGSLSELGEEIISDFADAIRDPQAALDYAEALPIVARFLTIELDPHIEGKNGIGRVPGEDPPRFGGQYRKKLRDPSDQHRVGETLERLIFSGYASLLSVNAIGDSKSELLDRSLDERWTPFMRGILGNWYDLAEGIDESRPAQSYILLLSIPAMNDYEEVVTDLKLDRGLRRSSEARMALYAPFFIAVGSSLWASNASRS